MLHSVRDAIWQSSCPTLAHLINLKIVSENPLFKKTYLWNFILSATVYPLFDNSFFSRSLIDCTMENAGCRIKNDIYQSLLLNRYCICYKDLPHCILNCSKWPILYSQFMMIHQMEQGLIKNSVEKASVSGED